MKKMPLKRAIGILLLAADRDLIGAGCGIRTAPKGEQREELREAMQRAGEYAHGVWYQAPGY